MDFNPSLFLGVSISTSYPEFTFASISEGFILHAISKGPIEEILSYAAGQHNALIAIDAPSKLNQGIVRREKSITTQRLSRGRPPTNLRLVEYQQLQLGFNVSCTPSALKDCPKWMQEGFLFYNQIQKLGYKPYPSTNYPRQWVETAANASFLSLLSRIQCNYTQEMIESGSIEGRIQRQLLLMENRVPLDNPMKYYEEITRHRLINGVLNFEGVHTESELNAMMCAYTAWWIFHYPEKTTYLGSIEEGQVYFPEMMNKKLNDDQ